MVAARQGDERRQLSVRSKPRPRRSLSATCGDAADHGRGVEGAIAWTRSARANGRWNQETLPRPPPHHRPLAPGGQRKRLRPGSPQPTARSSRPRGNRSQARSQTQQLQRRGKKRRGGQRRPCVQRNPAGRRRYASAISGRGRLPVRCRHPGPFLSQIGLRPSQTGGVMPRGERDDGRALLRGRDRAGGHRSSPRTER